MERKYQYHLKAYMTKKELPKIKRRLDRLFSSVVLTAANRVCNMCGKTDGKKDCSHIIPRQVLATRWNTDNALCLCFRCHQIVWHKDPVNAVRWLEKKVGKTYLDNLIAESKKDFQLDSTTIKEIETQLKEQYNSLNKEHEV